MQSNGKSSRELIPLPSIDEQREIVAEIEMIEREMATLEKEIAKAEELKSEIVERYLK